MDSVVDARGLSCPQPALLTRRALANAAGGEVTVLVDTMTQVQNCTRAAEQAGWKATWIQKGDVFELTLRK